MVSSSSIYIIFIGIVSLSLILPSNGRVYLVKSKNSTVKSCKVYRRPSLHELMDRVCLMCHEMFSHERPNMRSECRSNCFKSNHFQQCLKVFMATSGQSGIGGLLISQDDNDD